MQKIIDPLRELLHTKDLLPMRVTIVKVQVMVYGIE